MNKKNPLLILLGSVLGIVITELFNPGAIISLQNTNYYNVVFPLNLLFSAIESTLMIRGVIELITPFPLPVIWAPLTIVIPDLPFILTWVSTGLILGFLSRRVRSGAITTAFADILLIILYLAAAFIFQPLYFAQRDLIGQIQFGFSLGGPVIWAALFGALGGVIGGLVTRPKKQKPIVVDMNQIQQIEIHCSKCGFILHSNAVYCANCGATISSTTTPIEEKPQKKERATNANIS